MSLLIPGEAKFSIGVSSTPASSGQEKIDMSLDDLIKSRRDDSKKAPRRSDRRRKDPKKPSSTLQQAAQNSNRRAVGARRARRSAAISFRRGTRETKDATSMEVEKEIRNQNTQARGKRGMQKSRPLTSRRPTEPRPPTKRAIKAAVSAMTNAGFTVPDGMKVVINLEKDAPERKQNTSRGNQSKKDHPNRNNGGRLWGKKK